VLVPQALQLFLNAIEREVKRQGREAALERLFVRARHLPMHLRRKLFRRVHRRFGGNLEIVISGGAHLDPDLARRWELMGVTVLQGYGATEASPIISCDRPAERRAGAVGRPFPAVDLRINDDGEILAKGPNIFRGYWNNPAATQAVLRDGWYFTGDLGRIDADGFLYLSGRKKDLIVLANGQNVYPEDIEQCLIREPAVTDAVVIGLEGPGGGVQVHAALLLTDPSLAAAAVRAANAQLAAHQQIQGFTVWPDVDFPRTHTLKVKKTEVATRLRELQSAHEGSPASALLTHGSQDPMSTDPLRRLIGEVSGVATSRIQPGNVLGADLGLDSLMRVELLSAIEEELGVFVDEAVVTPETSVADLARYVAEAEPRAEAQGIVTWPLTPAAGIARELFLQGLVFPLYHVFWRVRVEGRERIQHLPGPVMVAANHHFAAGTFGMDPAAAWMALPRHLRRRTCTAGE